MKRIVHAVTIFCLSTLTLVLAGCTIGDPETMTATTRHTPPPDRAPTGPTAPGTGDHWTQSSPALPGPVYPPDGQVRYCDPDELGRPVCVTATLTPQMLHLTDIGTAGPDRPGPRHDPPGWPGDDDPQHLKVPLLTPALGGDLNIGNLVTGTRALAGADNPNSGLAHAFNIAVNRLNHNPDCPVRYSATPQYNGTEPVPVAVTVDMVSCDLSTNLHIIADNSPVR